MQPTWLKGVRLPFGITLHLSLLGTKERSLVPLSLLGADVFREWVDHRFEVWEEEGEALSAQEIKLKEIFQKTCDGLVRDGVYINLDNPNEGQVLAPRSIA
jgi:hypothetical protein